MAWQVITATDVLSEFTPNENTAITNLMGGTPTSQINSKLQAILNRTISQVRGYISAGDYPIDPGNPLSLPAMLIPDCIAIARWRFLVSAPQLKQLQTQERYNLMLDAFKNLTAVSQQKLSVEDPTVQGVISVGMWNSENKIIMRTHPTPDPASQFQVTSSTPQPYANPNAPPDN